MQVSTRDIHHYDRRLKLALAKLEQDSSISDKNKQIILSFIKFRSAQGLSVPRQVRYLFTLRNLSSLMVNKPFEDATKDDLVNVITHIEGEARSSHCNQMDANARSRASK